jgi:hypothetical protein
MAADIPRACNSGADGGVGAMKDKFSKYLRSATERPASLNPGYDTAAVVLAHCQEPNEPERHQGGSQ